MAGQWGYGILLASGSTGAGWFTGGAILVTLAAAMTYVNHRWLRWPATIALMGISLVVSLMVVAMGAATGGAAVDPLRDWLERIHFSELLLEGLLSFLLFAGALHVNINDLADSKYTIGALATGGVVLSTVLVGSAAWGLSAMLGLGIAPMYCYVFGALISPTDPIAVLAILKRAGAPRSLETKIAGESLFNDGIGVVVFLALGGAAAGEHVFSAGWVTTLFVQEALGGILLGGALGYAGYRLICSVDEYKVEILLTLALVVGGYALAMAMHLSGPLAMVVAGLLIGNQGRRFGMSDRTRKHLDLFWELVDEILNAVLFVLIGLEALAVNLSPRVLLAGLAAIPVALLARALCVTGPVTALRRMGRPMAPGAIRVMTWGGLRGGISVALALSLPAGDTRDTILAMTYCVVAFSILVQGLSIGALVRRVTLSKLPPDDRPALLQ